VEDFQEIVIRLSKYASDRFAREAAPALTRFAESSPMPFINDIKAAREKIVARNDEDRSDFLRKRGFSKAETATIIETVLTEVGRKPESIFDFVQGITAVARGKAHQDARLEMEGRAKLLIRHALRRCEAQKHPQLSHPIATSISRISFQKYKRMPAVHITLCGR
jgi:mRNA degradation ribonuclease J1/J2